MESADTFELLNIDEYAKRLSIGRTTIFKWKQDGTLVPGRHFIQKGKIVRYIWSLDVIREIHENIEQKSENFNQQGISLITKKIKAPKKSSMNFEY